MTPVNISPQGFGKAIGNFIRNCQNGDLFMSGSQAGTFKICGSYLEND